LLKDVPSPVKGWEQTEEKERTRVLDDEEIKLFWQATQQMGSFKGPMRLLLLTGQRRSEVAEMTWAEINAEEATWVLPEARSKNHRSNTIPLSDLAIEELPPRTGTDTYVFKAQRTGEALKNWDYGQTKLLETMTRLRGAEQKHFTMHDLRRTVSTSLAKMRVRQEVTERILNHRAGVVSGVAGIYNQYDYADEVANALQAWANKIKSLIDPAPSTRVTPLRAA
jgi:integrase